MRALNALLIFMLGFTIGGLQFGGGLRDVAWGGTLTLLIAGLRFAAGYLVLTPAAKELSHTNRTTKRVRRETTKLARKVQGMVHYLDGHEGKSYNCLQCR